MIKVNFISVLCCASVLLLSGCSGVRHSYESLLDSDSERPVIVLKEGEKREVLAVGGGFPGYWGIYPAIISLDLNVASVECEPGRSIIPFREPGILFGGETCYLEAKKIGVTWLLSGNKYTLPHVTNKIDLDKLTEDELFRAMSKNADTLIKLKVVPASDLK